MAQDRQLARSRGRFRDSGSAALLIGLLVAGAGGLAALLGTLVSDWLVGVGAMVAWLGVVVAVVGVVLLLIALVTNRLSHHRPFA